MMQKLVLGTANFGDNYGISEKSRLSTKEVDEILNWASGKIEELDTSEDYKGSHKAISKYAKNFKITTKINLNQLRSIKDLTLKVKNISEEIGIEKIERVLLRPHASDPNFTLDAIKRLEELRLMGSIVSLGLTVYETKEMNYFIGVLDFPITFQVPLNLLNRSFQEQITSDPTRYQGFSFYVRSVFLQGLILMNPEDIPHHLTEAIKSIRCLNDKLTELGLSTLEATFAFVRNQNWATGVLVGVTSLDEIKTNLHAFEGIREIDWAFLQNLSHPPARILDPRLW
jgi:aryl-alcohol dehydrogenase-like predicted oxidoreductase